MHRFSIASFIFTTYMLVTVVMLVVITAAAFAVLHGAYQRHVAEDLYTYTQLLNPAARKLLIAGDYDALNRYCRAWAEQTVVRFTIILPDGRVIADSDQEPATMENQGELEEVRDALERGTGTAARHSETHGPVMRYHATSLYEDDTLLGLVRLELPLLSIHTLLAGARLYIIVGAAIIVLFSLLVSMLVSRTINRPLKSMIDGVQRFARGDFTEPLETPRFIEASVLVASLNEMAAQLDERLRSVIKERNQQEAVLSSMVEGVLAVDNRGRIMTCNQAAARLADIQVESAQDADLRDVAPNTPLSQFVIQILNSAKPKESEFGNLSQGGRILQVHGSVLRDAHGNGIGAVVVLNDVTRLRRLEQVRRDFVANVSHELRTPITSIKGFVETLLDGALDSPGDARRFLEIIAKQSDRLNAILGDLLMLSRVEEGEEKATIELEVLGVREPLEAALQLCAKKASAKKIRVTLECDAAICACINPSLFEQAITNLIDNAVKYSPSGSEVVIRAEQAGEIVIRVEDCGCGIAAEHLPRLFERFYRVDKARSRALGGTGLGLSIVNHVITAHGGRVTVESTPGIGSTFSIYLPRVGAHVSTDFIAAER